MCTITGSSLALFLPAVPARWTSAPDGCRAEAAARSGWSWLSVADNLAAATEGLGGGAAGLGGCGAAGLRGWSGHRVRRSVSPGSQGPQSLARIAHRTALAFYKEAGLW
jgi:hypothetical protein